MCINELVSIINHKQYEIIKLKTQNKALLKQNKELLSVETLKNNEILILKLHIQKLKKLKLINGFKSKYIIQLFPQ